MTETVGTQMVKAPLKGGGGVLAIIPQDLDSVWRIASMAVAGRMAPKSLVDGKDNNEAIAACAIAIMAGAELGLTPLMALRSYAVVNGRPSLWGDGLKAVVRQSGKCEYIRTGSDQTMGWCEAKRNDTGETKRVEFTLEQAKLARLTAKTGPWTSGYADVMMERRATNRCLNDLFADVLGGIVDAQEALEDGPIIDAPTPQVTQRNQPPAPPEEPEDATDADAMVSDFDLNAFLNQVTDACMAAESEDALIEAWDELDVESTLTDNPDALAEAFDIRNKHLKRFQDAPEGNEGFPGDPE